MLKTSAIQTAAAMVVAGVLALSLIAVGTGYFPLQGNGLSGATTNRLPLHIWAGQNSPAQIVAKYYYYESEPLILNLNRIKIFGWPLHPSGTFSNFDAARNFTVTANPSSIRIGGPENQNEGATVTYNITAKSGSSGTYEVSLGGTLLPQGIGCESYILLQSGNGVPNYAGVSPCYLVSLGSATNPPYPSGYIFVQILRVTNSTA